MKPFHDGRDGFFEKRFGLFLHWGVYAIDGFHEQDQWRRRIPREEYVKLAKRWNPVAFDPDACHERGMPVGIYYSVVDWNHPNYPNQGRRHALAEPERGDTPDMEASMDFLPRQVRELCTN